MRGRQKELLELLERSGADLFALLTRLTLHQDIAEELMQELFIKLGNCRGPNKAANWDAYAYRAAINLAFDWRRRNNKRATLRLEQISPPASNDDSPLAQLVHAEQLQYMLDAIERLNKNSRQVIIMRYIQQASYETIGKKLDKTPHQVRALCNKALTRLRYVLVANRRETCERMEENVETK